MATNSKILGGLALIWVLSCSAFLAHKHRSETSEFIQSSWELRDSDDYQLVGANELFVRCSRQPSRVRYPFKSLDHFVAVTEPHCTAKPLSTASLLLAPVLLALIALLAVRRVSDYSGGA